MELLTLPGWVAWVPEDAFFQGGQRRTDKRRTEEIRKKIVSEIKNDYSKVNYH